jgi:hypothetical protein
MPGRFMLTQPELKQLLRAMTSMRDKALFLNILMRHHQIF